MYYKADNKYYYKYGKLVTEILSYDIYDNKIICQKVIKKLPKNVRRVSKGIVLEHFIQETEKKNYLAKVKLRTETLKETLEKELNWSIRPIIKFKNKRSEEVYNFTHSFITKNFLKL